MKYSGKVLIEKVTDREGVRPATRNPHARDNVNVAMGPRTGNRGTPDKRSEFITAKAAREPLAAMIENAYVARAHEYKEFEYTNGGSIHDNTRAEFKTKSRKFK